MIRRLEYLASADVLLCKEVAKLRVHLQVLFLRLFFTTDGAGRFVADAAEIRACLYAHELQQVSQREVESRMQELHRARLIKLYTEGNVGYGKVADRFWRQRDKLRKVVHPDETKTDGGPGLFDEPLPDEHPSAPPSPPSSVRKKPKASGVCEPPPLTSLHVSSILGDTRLASECLAELAPAYPRHDLRACLREAERYVRKQRGPEAEVTAGWFAVHWMPFAAESRREPPPPKETAEQRQARETEQARFAAESRARIEAITAGPEPERGTLAHAIWLEGRKTA